MLHRRSRFTWELLSVLLLLCSMRYAYCQRMTRYVTDQTNSLNTFELAALESKLSEFDKATSTQVVVVIVPVLESGSVEETSLRIAEENGIGQKGTNNGVLLFVAKDDRKIRIEVGYGLEGVLTDVVAGQIIRGEIVPRFRRGEFSKGITAGVDAIILATKNEYVSDRKGRAEKGMNLLPIVFIVMLFILFSRARRRRFVGGGIPPVLLLGERFGGGSSGWGGGGGGGFSGGGGSFGGGGASGSW